MNVWTLSTPGWNDVEIRIYPTRRAMKKAIREFEDDPLRSPMGYHCVLENEDSSEYLPLILLNITDCANDITDTVAHESFHAVVTLLRIKRKQEIGVSDVVITRDGEDEFAYLQGKLIKAVRKALNGTTL